MSRALIGHTGFVGSNLANQSHFDKFYNTTNITEIKGGCFSELVISGISAVKWLANKDPINDWSAISSLMDNLNSVTAERVILISTIDVYGSPVGVNEEAEIGRVGLHPYGLHRLKFEDYILEKFSNVTIVRLPGLYGKGLRKNIIYDYLNNNNVSKIDTRHFFQFYNLDNLTKDINLACNESIQKINLAVEPIKVSEIAKVCTGKDIINEVDENIIRYDFKSQFSVHWGSDTGYLYSKSNCLSGLKKFVKDYQHD